MIFDIDKNMKMLSSMDKNLAWRDALCGDFTIYGFPFMDREGAYNRMSAEHRAMMQPENPGMVYLASHTAGGQIYFESDTTTLQVYVKLAAKSNMCHMPATGQCGVDCYLRGDNNFVFRSCSVYDMASEEYAATLFEQTAKKHNVFLLNLPLYMGVERIAIGVSKDAYIRPARYEDHRRIVVYGTSIIQGGCASRPGMAITNILSRRFNCEVVNYGFSGSAMNEPQMGDILGDFAEQRLLIVDTEPNAGIDNTLMKNLQPFIENFRKKQPNIPILLISRIDFSMDNYDEYRRNLKMKYRRFLYKFVKDMNKNGDRNIYFLDGSKIFKHDKFEYTVDGIHPTDYGFAAMADAYEKAIRSIFAEER